MNDRHENDDCSHIDYISQDELMQAVSSGYSLYEFKTDLRKKAMNDPECAKILEKMENDPLGEYYTSIHDYGDQKMLMLYRQFSNQNWERKKSKYIEMLDDPRHWAFVYPDQDGWGLTEVIMLLCSYNNCIPDVVTMDSFLCMMYKETRIKGKQTCLDKWEMMRVCSIFNVTGDEAAIVDKDEVLKRLIEEKLDVMVLREDGSATTIRKMYRDCGFEQTDRSETSW